MLNGEDLKLVSVKINGKIVDVSRASSSVTSEIDAGNSMIFLPALTFLCAGGKSQFDSSPFGPVFPAYSSI